MILCCGEALIDMLPGKTATGESCLIPVCGGAVFNTAVALGRLGVETGLFTGLSTDLFGAQLTQELQHSKVSTALAAYSNRPTTLAFVELTQGQAKYVFYDENTAARMLGQEQLPSQEAMQNVSALFFGAISLIPEPCGSSYEALMQREHSRCITMLDPNIRSGFIDDENAYRQRLGRMISMADIVKFSDDDLNWYINKTDSKQAARSLLAQGPALVVITHGSQGVTAYSADGARHVDAVPTRVADSVGAGDTFNAGFLAALQNSAKLSKVNIRRLSGSELEHALAVGSQAAAITVSRSGANPPWKHELAVTI